MKTCPRGFSLVELMIVVVIVGVLAALGTYGVMQYAQRAKYTEARELLGRIGHDHLVAFENQSGNGVVLPFGGTAAQSRSLCPDAGSRPAGIGTATAPVSAPAIRAAKWQPAPSDFSDPGWACLKFNVSTPLYFGYGMDSTQAGTTAADGDSFLAYAIGDLDGDAEPSTLEYGGEVKANASGSSGLVLATAIRQARAE